MITKKGKLEKAVEIFMLLVSCLLLPSVFYGEKEQKVSVETKISLEANLENRLKKVLTEITGSEKIVVIVNVELMKEKEEKAKAEAKKDDVILPGIPLKQVIDEKKVETAMMAALSENVNIKKLSVSILLDKSIPPSIVEIVKNVATGLLGIDSARGDELKISQIDYYKQKPFQWKDLIYPPHIYWVITILVVIFIAISISLFLFGPFRQFAKEFVNAAVNSANVFKEKTTEQAKAAESGIALAGPVMAEMERVEEHKQQEKTATGKEPLFSFVNEGNIKELVYLLKSESPKTVAAVINYLSPEYSSRILSELSKEAKKEVLYELSVIKELDPTEVEQMEYQLRTKVDFLAGGEEKLIKILDRIDEESQKEVIEELAQKNPELAEKLRKSIIRLDILLTMDASQLQLVIRQVGTNMFGQIVKSMPAEMQEKIFSTLPSGAAARIKQEMEMGKPLLPQRLELEKQRLLDRIRRMRDRGLI